MAKENKGQLNPRSQGRRYITELLNQHTEKVNDLYVKYLNGMTDKLVAEEVIRVHPESDFDGDSVNGIRSRAWGMIYKEPKPVKLTNALRIAKLEEDNVELANTNKELAENNKKMMAYIKQISGVQDNSDKAGGTESPMSDKMAGATEAGDVVTAIFDATKQTTKPELVVNTANTVGD